MISPSSDQQNYKANLNFHRQFSSVSQSHGHPLMLSRGSTTLLQVEVSTLPKSGTHPFFKEHQDQATLFPAEMSKYSLWILLQGCCPCFHQTYGQSSLPSAICEPASVRLSRVLFGNEVSNCGFIDRELN